MSFRMAIVLCLSLIVGCQKPKMPNFISKLTKTTSKSEEKAPPRTTLVSDAPSSIPMGKTEYEGSSIQLTDYSGDTAPVELFGATVVATVNSLPIFADDVLQPHNLNLEKAAAELTPSELNRLRAKLIQQELPQHLEKALLISALRDDIEEEQYELLTTQVNGLFEREVDKLKERYNVETKIELERILAEQGTSLESLNNAFASRELSMFYIGRKSKDATRLSRQELMDWYEQNKAQYAIEAAVKWQQIRINVTPDGGREAALARMKQAIDALRSGTEFGAVAKQFSDGPKRDTGGIWDWTKQGSLADEKVERALFEIPAGKISQPLESDSAFVLVKVVERRDAGYVPFEDVQNKINNKLQSEARRDAAQNVIKELNNTATIWTIFDKKPGSAAPSAPANF
ncbi:MAG: peptidyl-prolyl cis-trans isomerase SurA [Planctomycetaceae bacterium]|jgi:peptidyl-prolyl cis-trans isomerase SurA